MSFYQRQIILPEIGAEGQKKLSQARILCIGAGGLGSPALLYLAAAGVGTIGIVDGDQVDETNLHRQVLFTAADIGKPKASTAAAKIKTHNPELKTVAHDFYLAASNAEQLISEYDLVVDGTDNFDAKYISNDICVKLSKPLVYGSISKFEGRVSVFNANKGACYRCLYPQPPNADVQNCAEAGILGAVAGVIGTMQALEAIKTILNLKPLVSKMAVFEFINFSTMNLAIQKRKDCICAGNKSEIKAKESGSISIQELRMNSEKYCLIDVREDHEWSNGHIRNAIHWPLSRFQNGVFPEQLLKTPQITVLYCQAGSRSAKALDQLHAKGIEGVRHLKGGFQEWIS